MQTTLLLFYQLHTLNRAKMTPVQKLHPYKSDTHKKCQPCNSDKFPLNIFKVGINAPRINLIGCVSCLEWQKSSVQKA